ncbi:helicase-like transcription factor CHR28 isoform X2 [Durio zibethinus]|uniref:Helicase-like transcription factor CHR28 isoform X2 n=1 Tax=Durio zibethinus TaxID=66656 RepID=A0A6P5X8D6_DURZI|nr:helicase-like transcription factor CHR28 isoform X2 [Durio zibethinus]
MMGEDNYNDSSGLLPSGDPSADYKFDDFAADGLCVDLDIFHHILEENCDPPQGNPEDPSPGNMSQEDSVPETIQVQSGFTFGDLLRHKSEAPDARSWSIGGSFDYHRKLEPSAHDCSPVPTSSVSFKEWCPFGQATSYTEVVGMPVLEMPSCTTASSFAEMDGNHVLDRGDNLNFDLVGNRTCIQFKNTAEDFDYKNALHSAAVENMNLICGHVGDFLNDTLETLEAPESKVGRSMKFSSDADMTSPNVTSNESTICHGSDIVSDVSDPRSVTPHYMNGDNAYFSDSSVHHWLSSLSFMSEEIKVGEVVEFPTESACSSGRIIFNGQDGTDNRSASQLSMTDFSDVEQQHFEGEGNDHVLPACGSLSYIANDGIFYDKGSVQPFSHSQPCISNNNQAVCVKYEDNKVITSGSIFYHSAEALAEASWRKSTNRVDDLLSVDEDLKQSLSDISPSISNQEFIFSGKDAHHYHQDINLNVKSQSSLYGGHLNLASSEQYFSSTHPITSTKMHLGCFGEERERKLIPLSMGLSKVSPESIHSNSSDCRSYFDDDPDICILEDISQPACSNQYPLLVKNTSSLPHAKFSNLLHTPGMGGVRVKGNDERLIFQVALQVLSQPKSEASPPDGVLTVPLLRHQRIALSWMTQKEKAGLHCLGGILADDQGLGKTVSTIALILMERPPSSGASSQDTRKVELETLNLDDDDEEMKQESDNNQVMANGTSKKSSCTSEQAKGRPAAGTLIVCPTSVLRQWEEELHNKVTRKANLSVLVYHGSNRTKDPVELAKYDVVLTTYSIVSTEVPKHSPVRGDDDEKRKLEGEHASSMDFPPCKKRKYPSSSNKKGVKHKKGVDESLLDSVSRPLAKVGWFRIVLDEAQSIKNHRTQVARACWGLRAKRRWCLSGTPIQNAIDDLYSYFRFLRYDPYASYKSFCSSIKVPITKNPVKGYPKLQAILQTIMLRRTKGTLLDGKPIINLPPKVIELKKVEFTNEERDFYSRLESDSRAQFKEYAAAGTIKQNYVNILLMLLRLRQACDHPLLVRGFDSNSSWRSSIETAKKLPQEKLKFLLSCLSSLALCGICNDPPDDAVVAICGHVFCNQCISELLSGDEDQCATANCKVRLSASSVFSNATLNSSLSEKPGHDSSLDCSDSNVVEVSRPCSEDSMYDSSKIRAALEVLQSLAKPQDHRLKTSSYPEGSSNLHSGDSPNGFPDEKNLVKDESLNDSYKVFGKKAIVFSQWTRMLDLFEACLKSSSIQYRRLDGTMSVAARDKAVKDFNTLPEVSVMIMSLKAASLGLNMVAACHVLLLDLWWNPTTEDQAIDRAHRIGQTRAVTVLRLTVKDTVEDRILALQQKKREMVASAFGEDETGGCQTRLTVEDLEYLFMA